MYLRDGIAFVRNVIGEVTPNIYSDAEIVFHLNNSARRMSSRSQCLQDVIQFTTTAGVQEYILPESIDQLTGVSFFMGYLYPLAPTDRSLVQFGGVAQGVPQEFYTRVATRITASQNQTAGLSITNAGPQVRGPRMVLGLWPIPNSSSPCFLHYVAWHPTMKNPFDLVGIPDRFEEAWCAYAIAQLKAKESSMGEYQMWKQVHDQGTQELCDYMVTQGQEVAPPQFGMRGAPYFLRGANTVLVVTNNPGMQ